MPIHRYKTAVVKQLIQTKCRETPYFTFLVNIVIRISYEMMDYTVCHFVLRGETFLVCERIRVECQQTRDITFWFL